MANQFEKIETRSRLAEVERYNYETAVYPYVVNHKNVSYDFRTINSETGNAQYRMTSESRVFKDEPSYIEVDKEGYIVREWD